MEIGQKKRWTPIGISIDWSIGFNEHQWISMNINELWLPKMDWTHGWDRVWNMLLCSNWSAQAAPRPYPPGPLDLDLRISWLKYDGRSPGSNRRRYVSTIWLAIFWGYIPLGLTWDDWSWEISVVLISIDDSWRVCDIVLSLLRAASLQHGEVRIIKLLTNRPLVLHRSSSIPPIAVIGKQTVCCWKWHSQNWFTH